MSFIRSKQICGLSVSTHYSVLKGVSKADQRVDMVFPPDIMIPFQVPKVVKEFAISFNYFVGKSEKWVYETKEQRDQEFEWILKQLDCKTNET